MLKPLWILFAVLFLNDCSASSKEEQCLLSARLNDSPDSAEVVANLGDRSVPNESHDASFWIRYSYTDHNGARVTSNMACKLDGGRWARDERKEFSEVMRLTNSYLDAELASARAGLEKVRACHDMKCVNKSYGGSRPVETPEELATMALGRSAIKAKARVYGSGGPLQIDVRVQADRKPK